MSLARAALSALALSIGATTESQQRIPIEFWVGSDDGLTQHVFVAIERELEASPRFTSLPANEAPDPLKLLIPTRARYERVNGRLRISYRVELSRGDRQIARFDRTCWPDRLGSCARQTVRMVEGAVQGERP